jgi:hypothetical protein
MAILRRPGKAESPIAAIPSWQVMIEYFLRSGVIIIIIIMDEST